MSDRIILTTSMPEAYQQLLALSGTVGKAAANAGLDPKLIELVKIRASQLNGCAFCLDMHAREARELGEDERRIFVLPAWRETELYTERERAALALTEAITTLAQVQDVPDEVYQAATAVLTEAQFVAVTWAATVINTFNRLAVTGRKSLPVRAA